MSAPQKLTKKQKKGLAFRERRGAKGKAKALDEDNDVPVAEDQDRAEAEVQVRAVEAPPHDKAAAKKRGSEDALVVDVSQPAKKRKRGNEEAVGGNEQPAQKKKRVDGEEVSAGVGAKGDKAAATTEKVKQRFILFVGNLKYTTTKDAIQKHFEACDPPPIIRLMTPKPTPGKSVMKSKGCAFLEFSHRNALQQGLKLHQSELEGRKINVELTAGGGGKSDTRMEKLKKRNRELHEQRAKQLDKQKPPQEGTNVQVQVERPQRYSTTSGVDQVPLKHRTWTVGDAVEDTGVSRQRSKKSRSRPRSMGTGVNSIPVG